VLATRAQRCPESFARVIASPPKIGSGILARDHILAPVSPGLRIAVVTALVCAAAEGVRAQSETQTQFFPEVDTFFKLSDSSRLLAVESGTVAPEVSQENAYVSLGWDHRITDRLSVRGAYRFQYTWGEPVQRENRIQLSGDVQFPLAFRLLGDVRSMVELRWINGDPSQRYRIRAGLQREVVGLFGKAHTFSGTAEVYYNTTTNAWNYREYTADISTLLSQKASLDVYYQRQDNTRSSPAHVNGVGLVLTLYLDLRKPAPTGVIIESGK
jgi:hypothetical protein